MHSRLRSQQGQKDWDYILVAIIGVHHGRISELFSLAVLPLQEKRQNTHLVSYTLERTIYGFHRNGNSWPILISLVIMYSWELLSKIFDPKGQYA